MPTEQQIIHRQNVGEMPAAILNQANEPQGKLVVEGVGAQGGEQRTPQTFRVDPKKIQLGTKATAVEGERLPPLPLPDFTVELVEINGEQVFKLSGTAYGRAEVKVIQKKDPKTFKPIPGQYTKRLSLGWVRRAIMTVDEETEKPTRQLIDVAGPDGEDYQFALTGTLEIAGKLTSDVVHREK